MTLKNMVDATSGALSAAVKPDLSGLTSSRRQIEELADRAAEALSQKSFDHPWLTAANIDTVGFSPATAEGQPLLLNGKSTTFWPGPEAADALDRFKNAVARGEFDDQLASHGQPIVTPKIKGERTPSDLENGSMSTGGGRTTAEEAETRFTENLDNRLRDRDH